MLQWDPHFVAEFLKAVAQETRLRIVRLLYLHAGEELSAGIIAVDLDVPPNLLSFHLKELVSVGVVCKTSSGRNVFYAITPKTRKFIHVFREEFGVRRKPKDPSEKPESDKWNAITDEVTH